MPFAVEVFKLQFTEEPSYSKLKHFLIKILLTLDVYPDMRFDWTKTDDTNLSQKSKDSDSSIDENDLEVDEHSDKAVIDLKELL